MIGNPTKGFYITIMEPVTTFSYKQILEECQDGWKLEVVNIFRFFDEQCDGFIPRADALRALELIGIDGTGYFHISKKTVSLQQFIDAVETEREKLSFDNKRRWAYVFGLISGGPDKKITIQKLQEFFKMFGHCPEAKYCEDFIDEFDRDGLTMTEIGLTEWIEFCSSHGLTI